MSSDGWWVIDGDAYTYRGINTLPHEAIEESNFTSMKPDKLAMSVLHWLAQYQQRSEALAGVPLS